MIILNFCAYDQETIHMDLPSPNRIRGQRYFEDKLTTCKPKSASLATVLTFPFGRVSFARRTFSSLRSYVGGDEAFKSLYISSCEIVLIF